MDWRSIRNMLVLHDMNSLKQGFLSFYFLILWGRVQAKVDQKFNIWIYVSKFNSLLSPTRIRWKSKNNPSIPKKNYIYFKPHLKIVVVYMYA